MTNKVAIDFVLTNCELPTEVREKLENMRDSLVKKSANRKPTATQIANENLKNKIIEVLTANGSAMTVTEISKSSEDFADLSNQKITSLVTQLKNADVIEKIIDGKKSTFKIK